MATGSNKSLPPSPPPQFGKSEVEKILQSGLGDFSLRELLGALLSSLAHAERDAYLQSQPEDKANGFLIHLLLIDRPFDVFKTPGGVNGDGFPVG